MALGKVLRLYEQHAEEWDQEFGRVSRVFADRMQCRKGCSMCCSQMFTISALEAERIARAVRDLPEPDRERLRRRATDYVHDARSASDPHRGGESVVPRTGMRNVCPALENDACRLYAARPLICRKWGIPIFDPSKPHQLHACELNFRAGESIDAGDLLDSQSALLERWVGLKNEARSTMTRSHPMTVAEAILCDPEPSARDTDAS